jgi:hypothetical protein
MTPRLPAATLLLIACGLVVGDALANLALVRVGDASDDGILAWRTERFVGETRYALDPDAGRPAVRADSVASASGLVREIEVDLEATPVLSWSWKVGNLLEGVDETRKEGDDYPARVYVVFEDGRWWDPRPRSLTYVWSSSQPRGSTWPNAFTERVIMVAVRDTSDPLGTWVEERRNVREDIRQLFGEEVTSVKAVAIMTDTDNSGQRATAWYGDIAFAPE